MNIMQSTGSSILVLLSLWSSPGVLAYSPGDRDSRAQGRVNSPTDEDPTNTQRSRIDPTVYDQIANSPNGKVYVQMVLNCEYPQISTHEQRLAIHNQRREEVLGFFVDDEFEAVYSSDRAALYGHINAVGLNRLIGKSEVREVAMSKVHPKVHHELNANGTVQTVVALVPPPTNLTLTERRQHIRLAQRDVLGALVADHCGPFTRFKYVAAFGAKLDARCLEKLEREGTVIGISPDLEAEPHLGSAVPYLRADLVHTSGYTGRYTKVAVVDDGFDETNPDLAGDIETYQVWLNESPWPFGWGDSLSIRPGAPPTIGPGGFEHGTYVASIITSPIGVAPDATILGIRKVDQNGTSTFTRDVKAVEWVIDLKACCASFLEGDESQLRIPAVLYGTGRRLLLWK